MVAHCIPVPYSGNDIERALSDDIYRFIPARIQVTVDYSGLGKTFLILIAEDYIRVARSIHITSLEVLRFHNLDRENIIGGFFLPLRDWRRMTLDHSSTSVNVHFVLELVQLMGSEIDVV